MRRANHDNAVRRRMARSASRRSRKRLDRADATECNTEIAAPRLAGVCASAGEPLDHVGDGVDHEPRLVALDVVSRVLDPHETAVRRPPGQIHLFPIVLLSELLHAVHTFHLTGQ